MVILGVDGPDPFYCPEDTGWRRKYRAGLGHPIYLVGDVMLKEDGLAVFRYRFYELLIRIEKHATEVFSRSRCHPKEQVLLWGSLCCGKWFFGQLLSRVCRWSGCDH
jgi:hypothetical protein